MPTPGIPGSSTTSMWVTSWSRSNFRVLSGTWISWTPYYCGGVGNNCWIVPWEHRKDSCVAHACVAWSDNSRWQFEFPSNSLRTRTFRLTFGSLLRNNIVTCTARERSWWRSAVYSLTLYFNVTLYWYDLYSLTLEQCVTDFGCECHQLWNNMGHPLCTSVMDNGTIGVTDFGATHRCHWLYTVSWTMELYVSLTLDAGATNFGAIYMCHWLCTLPWTMELYVSLTLYANVTDFAAMLLCHWLCTLPWTMEL